MSHAFNAPPAHPTASANAAAAGSGRCQSWYAAPNTTAASPIIDPTDRSMPPLMITGVNATASSPSSTLRRVTSKKFPSVKKFCAMAEKSATSAASASSRIHSPFGNQRSRQCVVTTRPRRR